MKKSVLITLSAALLIICCGCGIIGGSTTDSSDALDYTNAQKTSMPTSSDTADGDNIAGTPTPTTIIYEKKNVSLKKGAASSVNGYSVTVTEGTNDEADFVYAICEGQTLYISDGYLDKAYLCGRETGKTALIVCVENEGMYTTAVYRLNREKKKFFLETASETCRLISITDATIRVSASVDMFGTWVGERDITLTDKFKFEPVENLWVIEQNEARYLTALCDIRAREYESNKNTAVLEGSVLAVTYIDTGLDYAVLMDVQSQKLYKIYVESDGHGGYLLEDVGSEAGCFDNIQYAG